MAEPAQSRTQAERADTTRTRILEAALSEFSAHGLAGARTDQIATAAGVNKALLYYYFDSKENLYIAALEMAAGYVRDSTMAVFLRDATAGERILRTALNHFDRILSQGEFQRLMQQEMMRKNQGESGALPILVKRVFAPMHAMFQSLVREGIASGELIDVDPWQIPLVALGANVFYFLSVPVWRMVLPFEPLAPQALADRRKALVEFLGQALFIDRARGAELARIVIADTPMPELKMSPEMFRGKDERTQ
jgi:TetR/AcrR family transcriptional regulator